MGILLLFLIAVLCVPALAGTQTIALGEEFNVLDGLHGDGFDAFGLAMVFRYSSATGIL